MDKIPIHITKIKLSGELYEVVYNNLWVWYNTYEQIKDMAWNFDDVEKLLDCHERRKKINKIMNLDKNIYSDNVIYQKNDY